MRLRLGTFLINQRFAAGWWPRFVWLGAALMAFTGGLAVSRFIYELVFPRWNWLGKPWAAVAVATVASGFVWRRQARRDMMGRWSRTIPFFPLLLNLLYLFDPAVDVVRGRLLLGASFWLMALLLAQRQGKQGSRRRAGILFVVVALVPIYLISMPTTVGQADSFEFQVVAPRLGIAHPTGYPLYLILGKLFTLVPVGSVAWRLNMGSVLFGLAACSLVFLVSIRLVGRILPSLLASVSLGMTSAFWSQAIEAEVYALHALIISCALVLMTHIEARSDLSALPREKSALALIIGAGLTNHLTTLFLIPPAMLLGFYDWRCKGGVPRSLARAASSITFAFLAPLLLYIYLPLRWMAVNGEQMGFARFVDWVVGGRFRGALQWGLWLDDPGRFEIVGRLFLDNWGWFGVSISLVGFLYLSYRNRRMAAILLLTWAGFTFHALNYLVPDLAVFLIPAHVVVAVAWAAGLSALLVFMERVLSVAGVPAKSIDAQRTIEGLLSVFVVVPVLLLAANRWSTIDQSGDDGLIEWGLGVLELPLAPDGAILADSEKIAPLYYLQQSEGVRRDLDIMVLPDEKAYRLELQVRLAVGQTVYLARFLPGLEGIYYLRSMGPLTEVATRPQLALPDGVVASQLEFHGIRLAGYRIEPVARTDAGAAAVTLYWQSDQTVAQQLHVYLRWHLEGQAIEQQPRGQNPVNNYYPTNAWRAGEVVSDFHLLKRPANKADSPVRLQIALSPPFVAPMEEDWGTVADLVLPAANDLSEGISARVQLGTTFLDLVHFPEQIRPLVDLPITFHGYGDSAAVNFELRELDASAAYEGGAAAASERLHKLQPFTGQVQLATDIPGGSYQLVALARHNKATCGWLSAARSACRIGLVTISGVPLPSGAIDFDDKFALLSVEIPDPVLRPAGQLELHLHWQSLAVVEEDFTVFVQILDEKDTIVGQADAWPVQGTYPTSQWQLGEKITDRYRVQLDEELQPGNYRLQVGFYLLATLRRLPVLGPEGFPIDDKAIVATLAVDSAE